MFFAFFIYFSRKPRVPVLDPVFLACVPGEGGGGNLNIKKVGMLVGYFEIDP